MIGRFMLINVPTIPSTYSSKLHCQEGQHFKEFFQINLYLTTLLLHINLMMCSAVIESSNSQKETNPGKEK